MTPSFEYPIANSTQRRDLALFVGLSLMGGEAFPAVETNLVHYFFPVVAIVAGFVLFGEASRR